MSLMKGFMCQVVGALFFNLTIDYVLDANRKANVVKDEVATFALACVVSLFCFGVQVFTDKTEDDDSEASSSENTNIEKTKSKEVAETKEMGSTSHTTNVESVSMRETASVVRETMETAASEEARLITTVTAEPPITEAFERTELTAPEPPLEVHTGESELSAAFIPEPPSSKEVELIASATSEPPSVVVSHEPKLSATVLTEPPLIRASEGQVIPKATLATASEAAAATEKPTLSTTVMPEPSLATPVGEPKFIATVEPPLAAVAEEPKLIATVEPPLAAAAEEPKLIATTEPLLSSAPEEHVPKPPLATAFEEAAASKEPKLSAVIMPEPPLEAATDEPKLSATVELEPLLEAALEGNELKQVMPEPSLATTSEERRLIKPDISEMTAAETHEENGSSDTPENTELKETIILEPQLTVAAKETELLLTPESPVTITEETELIKSMSEVSLEPTTKEPTITVPVSAAPQETEFATSKIPEAAEAHEVGVLTSTEIEVPTENMCMVNGTTFETLETVSGEMKGKTSTANGTSPNMDSVFSSPVVFGSVYNTPIKITNSNNLNASNFTPTGSMDLITFSPLIWTESESELESCEEVRNAASTESLELVTEDVEAVTSNTLEVSLGSFREKLKDLVTDNSLIETHTLASAEAGATEKMDVWKSCTNLLPDEVSTIDLAAEGSSIDGDALSSAKSEDAIADETIHKESREMAHCPTKNEVKNLLELGESTEKVDVVGSVNIGESEVMKVLREVDMTAPNAIPTSNVEGIDTVPQVVTDAQQTDIQVVETSPLEDLTTVETDLIASTYTEATPVEEMNEVLIEIISMSEGDVIASSETATSSDEIRMDKLTAADMLIKDSNVIESMHANVLIEAVETTTKFESESIEINAAFTISDAGDMDRITSSKAEELSTEVDDLNILTETMARSNQEVEAPESTASEVFAKKLGPTTFGSEPVELNTTSSVELDSPTLITDRWPTVKESLAKFRKFSEDQVMSPLIEESKAGQEMGPSTKENVSANSMSVAPEMSEVATMGVHSPTVDVSFLYTCLPNS